MSELELRHGAVSDVGRVRAVNEDAFLASPPVFAVADGMGGHDGGDVASALVVEELAALAGTRHDPRSGAAALAAALASSQERITGYAADERARTGRRFHAGTTAVVALLVEDDEGPRWLVANLGDSRAYRYADGALAQVSVDHSLVQELVDLGTITRADVATHPERHVVTRALGGSSAGRADYFLVPLDPGDRLVLCSDGVTGMIDDAQMATILAGADDPQQAAERLVAAALGAGGHDNATAVVVERGEMP